MTGDKQQGVWQKELGKELFMWMGMLYHNCKLVSFITVYLYITSPIQRHHPKAIYN